MQKRHASAQDPAAPAARQSLGKRTLSLLIVAGLLSVGGGFVFADWWVTLPAGAQATYVGRQSCIQCHQQQAHQWEGSYHDLAMDLATDKTVLGDFNNAEIEHFGMTSRLFRDGQKFMIHTEGPDGEMTDFEIKYVFGVDPLQQYMVELERTPEMDDHEIGRVQVLRISWDTHRKKWFYLPPPDVDEKLDPSDDLHWTGIAQNWNTMCADCHSTNLQKNFDVASRSYHTTFSEIDVSCETCHGPGSLHVQLAEAPSLFWDRERGYALPNLKSADAKVEVQACAQCHSRRRIVHPDYRPGENYYDYFSNELLQHLAYHPDGQVLDEVYVYGSYLQSRMYEKGVRCTDCHDAHSTKVKHEGNLLCTSCHQNQHPAGKYDTPAHHFHPVGSSGAQCVECHMPTTTYMEVDPRRDHSLRVPRPDLSVALGTPNVCTGCHIKDSRLDEQQRSELGEYADWLRAARGGNEQVQQELARLDRWALENVQKWYGEQEARPEHFAHAFAAAREGDREAQADLAGLASSYRVPAIVRATAVTELSQYSTPEAVTAAQAALLDADPQVRAAAAASLRMRPDAELVRHVAPLLQDPVRLVRTEAARTLAHVSSHALTGKQRRALRAGLEELKTGLLVNNDRAQSHMMLGTLYEELHDVEAAMNAYETAMHVEPRVAGPRPNLAALLDQLAAQAARYPAPDTLQEARQYQLRAAQLRQEELELLARDAQLAPESAVIQYRYGLLLYLHDRMGEAEQALRQAVALQPQESQFMMALALLYEKQGRIEEALQWTAKLREQESDNPQYLQLEQRLRARVKDEG